MKDACPQQPIYKKRHPKGCLKGGMWGSNPRHSEPQSDALPTELRPPFTLCLPQAVDLTVFLENYSLD